MTELNRPGNKESKQIEISKIPYSKYYMAVFEDRLEQHCAAIETSDGHEGIYIALGPRRNHVVLIDQDLARKLKPIIDQVAETGRLVDQSRIDADLEKEKPLQ